MLFVLLLYSVARAALLCKSCISITAEQSWSADRRHNSNCSGLTSSASISVSAGSAGQILNCRAILASLPSKPDVADIFFPFVAILGSLHLIHALQTISGVCIFFRQRMLGN